jgi:hypothetical protein
MTRLLIPAFTEEGLLYPAATAGPGDTVGDALSLPPLLLERYLDAAEAVMKRAIPVPPLAKRKRTCHPDNLLPSVPPSGGQGRCGW